MRTVSTHEAEVQLEELLTAVEERHEEVTICRHGKPIARLVAVTNSSIDHLTMYPELGPVICHEDPSAPAGTDMWPEECR